MSYKFDESMTRILWAVAITGFALSLPFAAYNLARHGFSTDILLILFAGTIGAYLLFAAPFLLYGFTFIIGLIIQGVFLGLLPQEGDDTLTWVQSFKRAAVLLIASIVFFAALFLVLSGGGGPWLE